MLLRKTLLPLRAAPRGYAALSTIPSASSEPRLPNLLIYSPSSSARRLKNVRMTAYSLLFWVACVAAHGALSAESWARGVRFGMIGTPPLHDILHEVLPNTQRLRVVPEIGHALPVLYLSGLMCVVGRLRHSPRRALASLRLAAPARARQHSYKYRPPPPLPFARSYARLARSLASLARSQALPL